MNYGNAIFLPKRLPIFERSATLTATNVREDFQNAYDVQMDFPQNR
jgi:hypothetical protein